MDWSFKVERITDFSVLDNFECGVAQMDNFIHGNLKYCICLEDWKKILLAK